MVSSQHKQVFDVDTHLSHFETRTTDVRHLLEMINAVGTTHSLNINLLTHTSPPKIKEQLSPNMSYITVSGNDYFSSNVDYRTELLLP